MGNAWPILLQPHSEPVTREVTGHREGGGVKDFQAPHRWSKLVAKFHNIFDPPAMPVEQDTMHQIELLPNTEPHYRSYYRLSAAESAEVRR